MKTDRCEKCEVRYLVRDGHICDEERVNMVRKKNIKNKNRIKRAPTKLRKIILKEYTAKEMDWEINTALEEIKVGGLLEESLRWVIDVEKHSQLIDDLNVFYKEKGII